jgi:putative FmdB family regulatory protein
MPLYDFKCEKCSAVHEQIVNAAITLVPCRACIGPSKRLLSVPASIVMGDGSKARRAQRINEPIWRYPDGHIESLNSANTRPEE